MQAQAVSAAAETRLAPVTASANHTRHRLYSCEYLILFDRITNLAHLAVPPHDA